MRMTVKAACLLFLLGLCMFLLVSVVYVHFAHGCAAVAVAVAVVAV